jgi:N-glycosidase YbiA
MTIFFYSIKGQYGCFSNFSRHGFELDGLYWPTSEHYFQAQKFVDTPYLEEVRRARTPEEAARLGRRRDWPLRPDWEEVKDEMMRKAVLRKFEVNAEIRAVLIATGDEELFEDSPTDAYWGGGADRMGQNQLGQILMEVRTRLRA